VAEKSKPVALATTVALTGTLSVVGNNFDTRDNEHISIVADWAKHADETLLTLEVQGTLDGTTWVAIPVVIDGSATIASGLVAAPLAAVRYTRDVTGAVHIPLELNGIRTVRVRATSTSTGSRGTLSLTAVGAS
jgi:hypothetical protein